jgi:hypothetical protein
VDEFLWDKRNKEPMEIKKFMVELLREKLLNEENPNEYQKGITYVTLDRLDFYAEFATKILLDKIYFYDHFHPEILIKKGLFSDISLDDINEFYIPIDINITIDGENFTDNLNWDILNNDLIPEKVAENIVKDQNLKDGFIIPISYKIRRGIHSYVYELFKNLANNYEKYIYEEKILKEEMQIKTTRHTDDVKKYIPTFLFDTKLSKLLGQKRTMKLNKNEEYELLPNFLKNKKKEKNNISVEFKGTKNNIKSNKKSDKKKRLVKMNFIEHDKQSTTMEECEEKEAI